MLCLRQHVLSFAVLLSSIIVQQLEFFFSKVQVAISMTIFEAS